MKIQILFSMSDLRFYLVMLKILNVYTGVLIIVIVGLPDVQNIKKIIF